jgi:RNA polymerase sigma factor for flagellar operon FliA
MSNLARDERAQWEAYKLSGDDAARDALVGAHIELVKRIARRMQMGLPATVEYGDLVGYGMLGLYDALQKYLPEMGVKFETYATTRVRGAILDGLRVHDSAPRSLRQRGRQVTQVIAELQGRLGRNATDAEIASALGVSLAEFEKLLMELNALSLISLDQPLDSGEEGAGSTLGEMILQQEGPDPLAEVERQELLEELAQAIDSLPERERLIIALYYYEELTLKEIGAVLDVTESRVCQLHTRALLRLRARLEGGTPTTSRPTRAGG